MYHGTPTQCQNDLEEMLDKFSVATLVTMLSDIASEKAEHVRTNWQDAPLARQWERLAKVLDVTNARRDEMLTDAIARNRKREQEKRISHQSMLTDVRALDWDTFTTKRDLEAGKPCYMHTALPEIVAALRGEVYNGLTESAQYLEMSELANIGGYNFQGNQGNAQTDR